MTWTPPLAKQYAGRCCTPIPPSRSALAQPPPHHRPTWMRERSNFSSTASRVPCRPRTMASPSPPASAPPTPALVYWTCAQDEVRTCKCVATCGDSREAESSQPHCCAMQPWHAALLLRGWLSIGSPPPFHPATCQPACPPSSRGYRCTQHPCQTAGRPRLQGRGAGSVIMLSRKG